MLRGIDGFGKSSHTHTTSILRLSTDLPIVVEVADTKEKIDAIKPKLDDMVTEGLITEEKVKIILYGGERPKVNRTRFLVLKPHHRPASRRLLF